VAVDAVPWLGGRAGYEDWYLLDNYAALGRLNQTAVTGLPQPLHDAVATLTGDGSLGSWVT
jgi:hypothetical protein